MSSRRESTDCEGIITHFSVDEDDDGFIDYAQLEQSNEVPVTLVVSAGNETHLNMGMSKLYIVT